MGFIIFTAAIVAGIIGWIIRKVFQDEKMADDAESGCGLLIVIAIAAIIFFATMA